MLQVTDQQLTNLHYLRDVVLPHVRKMDKRGRLDLDDYESECGTFKCLLGWALSDPFFIQQGASLIDGYPSMPACPLYDDVEVIEHLFGALSYRRLFGMTYDSGDLDARAARLDEIIAEREAALA